ncbi:MAG: glycosyltransferase [Eubacteriales bacterium]|nr:glycosyltransferase [Eubacteriales bacterium]
MKKILVFNVAAELGGALTILHDFYNYVTVNTIDIHWYFVVSITGFIETENITILNYPEVKKSWMHRLLFDCFKAKKIVKKIVPDVIFSMQNVTVPGVDIPQILYLHQPIPFSSIKFSFRQSKYHWVYQNLISKLIYRSIKKADSVIVQTNWMAKSAALITGEDRKKFKIIPPELPIIDTSKPFDLINARSTFFYPVSFISYKNHALIIKAVKILEIKGFQNFQVLFTGKRNDAESIGLDCSSKCIKIIGKLSHEEVIELLRKTTLVFPSRLETFGLPLLEARLCKAFILAGDTPFSHDILDDYGNVKFFNVDNSEDLAIKMQDIITNMTKYTEPINTSINLTSVGWKPVVDILSGY